MATATFTDVVDRAVGDPLTEAIWDDQIKDNINQLAGAHRNLLVNGGFEPLCWQRGTGPFTADLAYTADRWQIDLNGSSTITVTQETSVVDAASRAALKVVYVHNTDSEIKQRIEDFYQLRGRTIALSVRVRVTTALTIRVAIDDSIATTSTNVACAANTWTTISITRAVDAAATYVDVRLFLRASMTIYFDNAMLVIGPDPAPYQPLHPQEDLARCQRYYAKMHGDTSAGANLFSYGAAGANCSFPCPHKVTTYGTPTVTKNGTWAVTNCGQPQVGFVDNYAAAIFATVTALGSFGWGTNSTDDYLSIESNP